MVSNLSINTIRVLGIDAINKANSGHPGIVLGAAPMAYTLWTNHLNVNPEKPDWINRDRFVLASGHGSMLLYALLHLSDFNVTIDDIKNFRQLDSKTPGHPEFGHTEGVDATSGPLGQGIPMAIGMAIAEKFLASKYNKEGMAVFDHYSYVICGDGDLMEGVTNEAASLAGHLKLGKVIVLYDSNKISLDGKTDQTFSEKTLNKFEAMGWDVSKVNNGNDVNSINKAINNAKNVLDKPSIIEIRTVIGYGSPLQGTNKAHGAPLGDEGGISAKKAYDWDYEPFTVPEPVYKHFKDTIINRGINKYNNYQKLMEKYKLKYPDEYKDLMDSINNKITVNLEDILPKYSKEKIDATRNYSNQCLNSIAKVIPNIIGGAADLASSTKAKINDDKPFEPNSYDGRNIYFGVREFAMATIMNGIALHKGLRVFGSTFFVFSDYLKPAVRMAALMKLPVIFILTHDSIAVGEDGPTHEPVEQLAMMRSIPNVLVFRPCDGNETAAAYKTAMETLDKPSVLVLSRQGLPTLTKNAYENVSHGAYIISESMDKNNIDGILISSGSETHLAIEAQKQLEKENIYTRVVNIVSMELFNKQDEHYKEQILPKTIRKRLSVEMATSFGWHKYVGLDGLVISVDTFGASGPASDVIKKYGFTVENILNQYKSL